MLLLGACILAESALAELRIVSYNTLGNPTTAGGFADWNVVLKTIGDERVNGVSHRIGIMALQEVEQSTGGADAQNIANLLNGLYGVSSYQASIAPFGEGFNLQAFVYDSSQVQLLDTFITDIGTRPTWRGRFRPVGYSSRAADLYLYSSHFKAFSGFESTRANEASLLRVSGNSLGQGANIIYAGDYNLTGGASEPAYATMLSSGNGQAIDPENGDFTDPLKRSYSSSSPGSRIDFQFITNALDDGEGLDLIGGSYHVFGRSQRGGQVITSPSALMDASDHLPVVADYQLPAWMDAVLSAVPMTLLQGEVFILDLNISNLAPVVAPIGADELDYTLNVVGDIGSLIGPETGMDMALGFGNLHQFALNTSSTGIKGGSIRVMSSSPGVENGVFNFDVMFEVLADGLIGDYNGDGAIDAADYTVWRDALSSGGTLLNDSTPEAVDVSDYVYWRDHFGELVPGGNGSHDLGLTVPEPSALVSLLFGIAGTVRFQFRHLKQHKARTCLTIAVAVGALTGADSSSLATGVEVRIATFNCSLSPRSPAGASSLPKTLSTPDNVRAQRVAEIIQRIDPDILLINEFNWDPAGRAADSFSNCYLRVGHDAVATGLQSQPVSFPYRFLPTGGESPFNTGIPSGKDLNNNGSPDDPDDAFGFGEFPGRYGMVVLSKYPIKFDEVRTFQSFLWKDMPNNLIPTPYYSSDEVDVLRLSSKSHWDIPIDVDGHTLHLLASHPTPPAFDGAEDRNGSRNYDEIRFWRDYVTPGEGNYIYDDQQFVAAGSTTPADPHGGLSTRASFVILGDQNADPADGSSRPGAINQLLESSRVNSSIAPRSTGGPQAAALQGGVNTSHAGRPAEDTAAFGRYGNLRVDYILPSRDLNWLDGKIFWFANTERLFGLVSHAAFPSDHRAVYINVELSQTGDRENDGVDAAD